MNQKVDSKRIYHPYNLWEDYKFGFYDNLSGGDKKDKVNNVLEMFNDANKTKKNMLRVIDEWKYSCEHNLTNSSMNKIAYLGQAACCIYAGVPSTVTMEAWSLLTNDVKERSNKIAEEVLNIWLENNKNIQLCLNLD